MDNVLRLCAMLHEGKLALMAAATCEQWPPGSRLWAKLRGSPHAALLAVCHGVSGCMLGHTMRVKLPLIPLLLASCGHKQHQARMLPAQAAVRGRRSCGPAACAAAWTSPIWSRNFAQVQLLRPRSACKILDSAKPKCYSLAAACLHIPLTSIVPTLGRVRMLCAPCRPGAGALLRAAQQHVVQQGGAGAMAAGC